MSLVDNSDLYLTKYKTDTLIFMKDNEKIIFDPSNVLNIEYLCDYEFNIRAILKVTIRVDIRKKLWILKNKKDIICKFELSKVRMDIDYEEIISSPEEVWNREFGIYLNDEDDATDVNVLEERVKKNETEDFDINDLSTESYHESENVMDIYLFNKDLLSSSTTKNNEVITKNTIQQIIGRILTQSKHKEVLMSPIENDQVYEELLLPANPAYKNIAYLDQYYGLYKTGAIVFYDADILYILNTNGKLTAKREDEWHQTVFYITEVDNSTPGNGMFERPGEKVFYCSIPESSINPQNVADSDDGDSGNESKLVLTDTIGLISTNTTQGDLNQRNDSIIYGTKDANKYSLMLIKARTVENKCILYISSDNLDINAFTPNKVYNVVFEETSKQERFGKYQYRLAYAYHYLKLESEFMTCSHQIILKRCISDEELSTIQEIPSKFK